MDSALRRESLDQTLFWTAADLEVKLRGFQRYFNGHRTHSGLEGRLTYVGGSAFLAEFSPGAFDLILTDLMMPDITGFDLFRRIREQGGEVLPVVAITASTDRHARARALEAGFCDYLTKPILDIDRFRAMINSHVGSRNKNVSY